MVKYVLIILIALLCLGLLAAKVVTDPSLPLLLSEGSAEWIRFPDPVDLRARGQVRLSSEFRWQFDAPEGLGTAVLRVRARNSASIWLNDELLLSSGPVSRNWKKPYEVDLAPSLKPGMNQLRIRVEADDSHPVLLAVNDALKIYSGPSWEASEDGSTWTRAVSVNAIVLPEISYQFPTTFQSLAHSSLVLGPVFAAALFLTLFLTTSKYAKRMQDYIPEARTIRFIIMGTWMVMAVNNIGRIPDYVGMDVGHHLEYIAYIADHGRVPFAQEGWQMFMAPFYYIISAALLHLVPLSLGFDVMRMVLRVIPLLCGLGQFELCYRTVSCVYPDREDLKCIGTIIGGFLPMNVYISQVVGNEPLSGFLSGTVVLLMIGNFFGSSQPSTRIYLLMGLLLGLAILTKPTAILLVPPLLLLVTHMALKKNSFVWETVANVLGRMVLVLGVALAVSGWYFVRNWLHFGRFFLGGWDPLGYTLWWQDPSYRTIGQLTTFGTSLIYPIYSAVAGFWDSLYSTLWLDGSLSGIWDYAFRPPWNYNYMLSLALLSLVPTAAILLGGLRGLHQLLSGRLTAIAFAAGVLVLHIIAMVYLYICVPIYCIAKATYTLGLIPCYALLCAGGLEILLSRTTLRLIIWPLVVCWTVCCYVAFFVVG